MIVSVQVCDESAFMMIAKSKGAGVGVPFTACQLERKLTFGGGEEGGGGGGGGGGGERCIALGHACVRIHLRRGERYHDKPGDDAVVARDDVDGRREEGVIVGGADIAAHARRVLPKHLI